MQRNGLESLVVNRPDAGRPLQDFLADRLGLSRRAAKAIVDGRSVWVNRACVWMARHALKTGDVVEFPRAVAEAARRQVGSAKREIAPEERKHVRTLVEDGHYVVADKPAGLPSCDDARSVEAVLREQLACPTLQAVHRLDRETTGCLLFARDYEAYLKAVEVFKTHAVTKIYRAIVAGSFPYPHQTVREELDGQRAVTEIRREMTGDGASFLRVRIETGRTNQIRRHLAGIRYPIVGDRQFGLKSARDARLMTVPRTMLHAASLQLPNPYAPKEELRAHSPLPADFRRTLRIFGMGR